MDLQSIEEEITQSCKISKGYISKKRKLVKEDKKQILSISPCNSLHNHNQISPRPLQHSVRPQTNHTAVILDSSIISNSTPNSSRSKYNNSWAARLNGFLSFALHNVSLGGLSQSRNVSYQAKTNPIRWIRVEVIDSLELSTG